MQTMQRVMPIFFALIYISIPAGVNIYFIVSSLFRIAQQDGMYRWDPSLQAALERLKKNTPTAMPTAAAAGSGGILARFREAAGVAGPAARETANAPDGDRPKSFTPPRVQSPRGQAPNRSKNKKPRRSR
jgi:YidC/Oxa1 family membrane protein insertase